MDLSIALAIHRHPSEDTQARTFSAYFSVIQTGAERGRALSLLISLKDPPSDKT